MQKIMEMMTKNARQSGIKVIIIKALILLLCCFAGIFVKRAINPLANVITDALHIPGGISTSASLMFLVIGAGVTNCRFGAIVMATMQGSCALMTGMTGSMGILLPIAYLLPGFAIDAVMLLPLQGQWGKRLKAFLANIAASLTAALFADIAVFHLPAIVLLVYLCVAAFSGAICGCLAASVINGGENE
ncbi:MAG: hypothetical protein IJ257_08380 [Treponema sp.]|nr:hypothetical protein [Treponema sp.]